jgi:hypothetical protein
MPTLEYDDVVLINQDSQVSERNIYTRTYLLGISNVKRIGMVKDCHAFMYLEGTTIRHVIAMWNDNKQQYTKISVYSEIELFTISDFYGVIIIIIHVTDRKIHAVQSLFCRGGCNN